MIELDNNISILIDEILELISNECVSVELWGTRVLPYIQNKHDWDVAFVFSSLLKKEQAVAKLPHSINEYRKAGLCLHFHTTHIKEDTLIYAYQCHYVQSLKGYEIKTPLVNILDIKEEYLDFLQVEAYKLSQASYCYRAKIWYHIYTDLCILYNNSYELTEEQIKNINILHDLSEGCKNLIDYCIEELLGDK